MQLIFPALFVVITRVHMSSSPFVAAVVLGRRFTTIACSSLYGLLILWLVKETGVYVCMYSSHKIRYPQALGHAHSNYSLIYAAKYIDKNMI